MQPDRDERDAEIEALRRQVEEHTMRLKYQETHGSRGSSYGYASDGFKDMNPFASKEVVGDLSTERFFHLSTIKKFFEYKEIPADRKVKLIATRLRGYTSI
ncbi:unnamed protein product [Musa textilis]